MIDLKLVASPRPAEHGGAGAVSPTLTLDLSRRPDPTPTTQMVLFNTTWTLDKVGKEMQEREAGRAVPPPCAPVAVPGGLC